MNALINKTSSQAFFLRVLKVIIQLREAALLSIMRAKQSRADKEKKEKAAAALQAAVSTADALTASASTPVAQGSETTSDQTSHPTQGKSSTVKINTVISNKYFVFVDIMMRDKLFAVISLMQLKYSVYEIFDPGAFDSLTDLT